MTLLRRTELRRLLALLMVLAIFIGLGRDAQGAVVLGSSSGVQGSNVTSLTWSHTVSAGSNRVLMVRVANIDTNVTVSGVTFGGVALTSLATATSGSGLTALRATMYYLVAPAVSTANVVVTMSASARVQGYATNVTNVSQTTPFGATASASGSSTAPSVTVAGATGDLMIDMASALGTVSSATAGSGQTAITGGTGSTALDVFSMGSTKAGAASVTMSWTMSSTSPWVTLGVAFKQAPTYTLSGTVFEDVNYGGGAGRSLAGASGAGLAGATVELYGSGGAYVSNTTTAAGGSYSFSGLAAGTYYVRVVSSTVTSQRSGSTAALDGVLTFRTDASGGSAAAVTNYVGGTNPALTDPGGASSGATFSTSTFVYSAGLAGTAQAVAPATISSSDIGSIDFGFNFDTVVNTSDTGPGSLRQAVTNANTLGGDASLAQSGRTAAIENIVFMISNGTAGSGLRGTYNYFTTSAGGYNVATITPASLLPTITSALVLDAQTQPGWSLAPLIELNGTSAGATTTSDGLQALASNCVIRGFVINRFAGEGIYSNTGDNLTIQGNYIGTNAAGTAASANNRSAIYLSGSGTTGHLVGGTTAAQRNVLSGNARDGIAMTGANNSVFQGNYIGVNASASGTLGNGMNGLNLGSTVTGNTIGGTAAGAGNVIAGNTLNGVTVPAGASGNTISGNSIYGNAGIGIDLDNNGVTANDGAKTNGQGNLDMDFPVLSSASLSGTTLTVAGYVGSAAGQASFAGARVEFFASDNDASGYGEGKTYLGSLTTDASGNFSGTLSGVSGLTAGSSKITGTATDGSGNTSEFGPNTTVALAIFGNVFEDTNYGGGAGRSLAASGGAGIGSATVELYNSTGTYVSTTASASDGSFALTGLSAGTYYVRVVGSSVKSQRSGTTSALRGVMTYRTDASSGSAAAVTDNVGGTNPALVDPGAASSGAKFTTTTGVYSAGLSGTAQSFSPVVLAAGSSVTGVDFGFNFDIVVNTNDSGQGSLRQAITNANTLSGDASLAQSGRTAAIENLVFMISNGTAGNGLRGAFNAFTTGAGSYNVATITPASALPGIATPMVIDAQTQPGWSANPLIELKGNAAGASSGLTLSAAGSTVRGLVIDAFSQYGISIGAASNTVQGCWIGLNPAGSSASGNSLAGIAVGAASNTLGGTTASARNVISGNGSGNGTGNAGILVTSGSGNLIQGNTIGLNAAGTAAVANLPYGIDLGSSGNTIGGPAAGAGNVSSGNTLDGLLLRGGADNTTVQGNFFGANAANSGAIANGRVGVNLSSNNNTFGGSAAGAGNVVRGNATAGVSSFGSVSGNAISGNSIFGNGGVGIDLGYNGLSPNDGAKTAGQPNLLMDYPVFTSASVAATTLTVAGYVGSAAGQSTFASARVEVFVSDATNANGQGKTYLGYVTTDASGNFSGTITGVSGVTAGTSSITGTATDGSNNTSEFGPNKVAGYVLSGTVFEDLNYGGGAGRNLATAAGTGIGGATVELYNSGGVWQASTTTAGGGSYSFGGLAAGSYFVRVVNGSVLSTRSGSVSSLAGVMTYRSTAASGTAVDVTDNVGGGNPALVDPGAASSGATFNTSTFVYSAVLSGTAQSVTPVTISTGGVANLDFGFNFDTVVNTNDTGQGSLRQAMTNANTLGGDASLAQSGRTAAIENLVFMISNGTTGSGLRSANNYFSGGVATIAPASGLPTISTPMVIDAQTQPGWSSAPIVDLNGAGAGASVSGLNVNAYVGSSGSTLRGFVIRNFTGSGINLVSGSGHTVAGNYLGISAAGTAAAANTFQGINIFQSGNNTIGGTATSARNVISGNSGNGIVIAGSGATGNVIAGNYLGTNAAGTAAIKNGSVGIDIGTSSNTVGGTAAGAGNLISGNTYSGIQIDSGATGNTVQGNTIGLGASGAALGNGNHGVYLVGTGNTVGGSVSGAGNVISGNVFRGVRVDGASNTIAGNIIGLNPAATTKVGNADGIYVNGAANTTIGGTTALAANTIAGNNNDGIVITGSGATGTLVRGNWIGSTSSGTAALGNGGNGISIANGAGSNTIGGTAAGTPNTIRNNTGRGVSVSGASTGNAIETNSIYGNTQIGIDLGADGITANDGAKTASQPNLLMDAPVFTSATMSGVTLTVAGYVGSAAGQSTFASSRVEVFASDGSAASGSGQTYLGFLTADASGNFSGTIAGAAISNGSKITATATDTSNNSSEFGINFTVGATIGGTVFEDLNYGGGAGRSLATSGGSGVAGATVELYNSAGTYVSSTSTAAGGAYAFNGLATGTYYVRVAGSTVASQRTGTLASLVGVPTYQTDASSGSAVAVTDRVGGTNPALADPGTASGGAAFNTGTGVFSAGLSGTAQSFTPVALPSAGIAGVDFGFNFDTVVNTNDSGPGSLRQAITNANTLGGDASLAQSGRTAAIENLVFMISNGTAGSGLRSAYNYFTTSAGAYNVATIMPTSVLPTVSSPLVIDAQTQPGWTLSPIVEINGAGAGAAVNGLTVNAGGSIVRGLVINRFTGEGFTSTAGAGLVIQGNYIGTNAAGSAAAGNARAGIWLNSSAGGHLIGGSTAAQRNVISGNTAYDGIGIAGGAGSSIQGNYIGLNASGSATIANGRNGVLLYGGVSNSTVGGTTAGTGNRIAGNTGRGINLVAGATGCALLGNSIYGNGNIGIDLDNDGATTNDGAKTAGQGNLDMDYPVFTSASLSGTTLSVAGYVGSAAGQSTFASARVEVFVSDATNANGQGKTYLGYVTADANGNFSGSISGVAGLTAGSSKITGTATDTSNNTSEFGPNLTAGYAIAGTVFEDANYGGGAGRSLAGSGGSGVAGATVELYNSSGSYVSSTTTGSGGTYSFASLAAGSYSVRVVGGTVASQRSGSTAALRGVMTWRSNASSGSAVAVTDFVGGSNPALVDPGAASSGATLNTSTGVYSAGLSGTAQALAPVTLSAAGVAAVDFGFNFDTIVNTNDSGAGSLRQAITNANTLGGDTSLAQSGRTAAIENLVFMISNGTAGSGLRSAYNYFTTAAGGYNVATIAPTSALPTASAALVIDAQTQPGWSANPLIELSGASAGSTPGLTLNGAASVLRGLIINRFSGDGLALGAAGDTVAGNWIGLTAAGTAAAANTGHGINIVAGGSNLIGGAAATARNVISGNGNQGIEIGTGYNNVIQGNYLGTNAAGTAAVANGVSGIYVHSITGGNTIGGSTAGLGNLISGNGQSGITLRGGNGSNLIKGNVIGLNAAGNATIPNGAGITLSISGSNNTIGGTGAGDGNTIAGNTGNGIVAFGNATNGNAFLGNSIYGNGGIGIDLGTAAGSAGDGATANDGAKTSGQPNLLMDTPVFTSASLSGTTLSVAGYVGSAASQSTFASSRVEMFVSDGSNTNGQGKTYLGYLTADASGNFSGAITGVSGVTAGSSKLTATATDGGNNTSEFGPNVTVMTLGISGTVFEDGNYGGGAGRSLVASGGSGVSGATVELYNASGAYLSSTTTASDGSYSFTGAAAGSSYFVRVAGSTVVSTRSGSTAALAGVMTYRTTGASGSAVAVTDAVGGTNPALADPGAAGSGAAFNTSSYVYSAGPSGTAQAVAPVSVGTGGVSGLDFGFNFDTVVNTNDSGAGSLRQAITNANTLGGDAGLAQSGRTAAIENIVFMLPNGTSAPGLRPALNAFNTVAGRSAVATVTLASALPDLSTALVLDAQTQPGWGASDSYPVVEINAAGAGANNGIGISSAAGNVTVRGFIVNRAGVEGIKTLSGTGNGVTIQGCWSGINAAGTSSSGYGNGASGISLQGGSNHVVGGNTAAQRNLTGGNYYEGISATSGSGHVISGNYVGVGPTGTANLGGRRYGILVWGASGVTISGNTVANQGGSGIALSSGGGNTVQGNIVGADPSNGTAMGNGASPPSGSTGGGIYVATTGNSIGGTTAGQGNVVRASTGAGVTVTGNVHNAVLGNSIYGNTGIGIDLGNDGATANDGAKTAGQPNLLMDTPVFTSASLSGTTLTVAGYIGSAANQSSFASSRLEVFASDATNPGGQGKTYLGYLTADANGNFSGTLTGVAGLTAGSSKITGTATDTSNNTSEFGPNFTAGYAIAGTVYEDANYGGGAGRSLAASGGTGVAGATVELYNGGGSYVSSTTTAIGGSYGFGSLAAGSYSVRVVSGTVASQRSGSSGALAGVLTWRADASSGAAVAVTDYVGGTNPALADPGAGSGGTTLNTTTGVFSAGLSGTAQALAPVTLSTAGVAGIDFGFNFDTVVNTNDSGAGSLRQAITNANALGADASLAQGGRTAAIENLVFMIANGTSGNGLRGAYNYFATSAGGYNVATIAPASGLPTVSAPLVIDAQTQPGWTLAPIVELNGSGAGASANGLWLNAAGSSVRGLVINRFGAQGITSSSGAGLVIQGNYIGTNAAGTAAAGNGLSGIWINSSAGGHLIGGTTAAQRNLLSGNTTYEGLAIAGGSGISIQGNAIGTDAAGTGSVPNGRSGILMKTGVTGATIGGTGAGSGNTVAGNTGRGINVETGASGVAVLGNAIYGNGNIGIDLGSNGATANDGAKTAGQANLAMDAPVFSSASLAGTTLTVAGYVGSAANQSVFASARVEVFVSDGSNASGQGKTYLGFLTADAGGNFAGSFSLPGGVTLTAGVTKLTGTATDGAGNSSEFGPNFAFGFTISGKVFEDVQYGGGAGRSLAASGGSGVGGATVELYNAAGGFTTSTTSLAGGGYSFGGLAPGSYAVRVVGPTVASQRSGSSGSLVGVLTWLTDASSGSPVAVTDRVGGNNPALADPGAAAGGATLNTGTGVYSAGLVGTAQALARVAVSAASITGVDFGFNFDTVVNTSDSGAGSLRQAITNANTLGGDAALAQSGRPAAIENLVFMLPNGTAGSGLRSAYNVFTTGGSSGNVATITPTSALPAISTAMVIDAQTQPGWTLNPVIELRGSSAGASSGFVFTGGGTTLRGFVIDRFGASGVSATAGGAYTIQGNWIGLDPTGAAKAANAGTGISIASAGNGDLIGGTTAAQRNVVSGNSGYGIAVSGGSGHQVQGNYIGSNAAGTAALGNTGRGVSFTGTSTASTIGGTAAGAGNVIAGNTDYAVWLQGSTLTLQGNLIGLGADGSTAMGNTAGVFVQSGGHLIGGTSAAARNVIAGTSGGRGIWLNAGGNTVQGNYVGTNAAGTAPVPNQDGIYSKNTNNVIGGTAAGAGNLISGNARYGVQLNAVANGTTVQGNVIGLNASGTAAIANGTGVEADCSSGCSIGGTASGAGNTIAGNSGNGVQVASGSSGNAILGNSIYGNGGLGIDLGGDGLSANDGTTTAGAANLLMDSPVLSAARARSNQLTVAGYIGTAAGQSTFGGSRVELFAADNDSSGYGEGKTFLGTLTADASGNFSGTLTMPVAALAIGTRLTATATDGSGNTSEFGANFTGLIVDFVVNSNLDEADGSVGDGQCLTASGVCTLRAAIAEFNTWGSLPATPTIVFAIPGCTAYGAAGCSLMPATALPSVTRAMAIDATTQTGWNSTSRAPMIELNGAAAPAGVGGLVIAANDSSVRGLVVNRFNGAGITLAGDRGQVAGSYLGTDVTGSSAQPNSGANGVGIRVTGSNNSVGGTTAGDGNLISGNASHGVVIAGGAGNAVLGNTIGLNAAGSAALGNGGGGVAVSTSATAVGGTAGGAGNVISGNGGGGVLLLSGNGNGVLGNSIYANTGLGIDLGNDGVSANDGSYAGGQPNRGMDQPVITGAGITSGGTTMTVYGYVGTGAGQALFAGARIEFFKAAADPSGYGEGQTSLGSLTADANGRFSGSLGFGAGAIAVGDALTATATDSAGNTSEFGPNWITTTSSALTPASFDAFDTDAASTATSGVLRSRTAGAASDFAVIALASSGSGLHPGFTGSVTLTWLDARDDSGAASGSCRASWVAVGSAGTASFSNQNRVTVSLTPPAAATRVMRLQMSTTSGGSTVTACSGDAFAALPAALVISGASDADAATAGTGRALDNVAAYGGVVHRAGQPFTLSAEARDATGARMTGYDGTPVLAVAGCLLPGGCTAGALGGNTVTAAAGVYTNTTVTYAEVGAISLQLSDATYGAIDAGDTPANTRTISSAAAPVGRFVPDSLVAAVSTPGQFATGSGACLAAGSGATFFGQGFGWTTAPQVTVTARNAAGGTTLLWTGALMKLASGSRTPALVVSAAGLATVSNSFGGVAVSDLGSGQARLSASSSDRFVLDLPAGQVQASTTPVWAWSLAVSDGSEAGVAGNPTLAVSATQAAVGFDLGALFHSGRLGLAAAHGDARMNLRALLQLQRYTDAGWVTMTEDRGCVAVAPQNLGVELPSGVFAGASGDCAAPMGTTAVTEGGRAWLTLPGTPGAAAGRLRLRVAGTGATGHSCAVDHSSAALVPLGQPWLLGGSTGSGPAALATWGAANRSTVLRRETW